MTKKDMHTMKLKLVLSHLEKELRKPDPGNARDHLETLLSYVRIMDKSMHTDIQPRYAQHIAVAAVRLAMSTLED